MEIKLKQRKNVRTLTIEGDINLPELKKVEDALLDTNELEGMQIDLTKVTYTSSSFLNIIIMVNNRHPETKITILNPNELVMELLTLTGIDKMVEIKSED